MSTNLDFKEDRMNSVCENSNNILRRSKHTWVYGPKGGNSEKTVEDTSSGQDILTIMLFSVSEKTI